MARFGSGMPHDGLGGDDRAPAAAVDALDVSLDLGGPVPANAPDQALRAGSGRASATGPTAGARFGGRRPRHRLVTVGISLITLFAVGALVRAAGPGAYRQDPTPGPTRAGVDLVLVAPSPPRSPTPSPAADVTATPTADVTATPTGPRPEPTVTAGPPLPRSCPGPIPFAVTLLSGPSLRPSVTGGGGRPVLQTWRGAQGRTEVAWPPRQRQLYATLSDETGQVDDIQVQPDADSRGVTLVGYSPLGQLRLAVRLQPWVSTLRPRPCDSLEIRASATNGFRVAIVLRLFVAAPGDVWTQPLDYATYSHDPLVAARRASARPIEPGGSVECDSRPTPGWVVVGGSPAATPVEALRAFLDSAVGAEADLQPGGTEAFTEYRMRADGSYRYEHLISWDEHVAVTVRRSGGGWAVTAWNKAHC